MKQVPIQQLPFHFSLFSPPLFSLLATRNVTVIDFHCISKTEAKGGANMKPAEIVKQWVDAFNAADIEAIMHLYSDNAVNHQVANQPVEGKPAIRKMFTGEFAAAKMVCIVENIFEDGAWAILEWKDPLGLRGCGFFQVENDKIVFQRGYWDKLSFLKMHNLPTE